jgi:hypothetical protein
MHITIRNDITRDNNACSTIITPTARPSRILVITLTPSRKLEIILAPLIIGRLVGDETVSTITHLGIVSNAIEFQGSTCRTVRHIV